MCGIVGAVSTRNIVPILIEGLKRLEYRGYDSCGVAVRPGRPAAPGAQHGARGRAGSRCGQGRHRLGHRHRPHPLGHARRARGAQRAPALQPQPHRAGAQRHHREPRRAARRTAGPRLRLQQPDRHRGHRPPGGPPVRRRPVRRGAARHAAAEGRLCHRRVLPRRAAARGGRARGLAADPGRGRRARTSWPATPWRWPA